MRGGIDKATPLTGVKHTMDKEALEAGMWKSTSGIDYPRLQVLTVADLMRSKARSRLPIQEKKSILDYKAGRRNRHNTQQELDMTP